MGQIEIKYFPSKIKNALSFFPKGDFFFLVHNTWKHKAIFFIYSVHVRWIDFPFGKYRDGEQRYGI